MKKTVLLTLASGLLIPMSSRVLQANSIHSIWHLPFSISQQIIKGRVLNEQKQPLGGVTINVIETGITAVSDDSGHFSISSKIGENLKLKMIGYEESIMAVTSSSLEIVLIEQGAALDEVVVVGYGVQKKVNLTGAVSQIDSKILDDRPVSNATQALQGAVPNLNINFSNGRPGTEGSVNVRGFASINSTNASPLILIDGVPGSINNVNPRDIENISVLKDAAASAIYGARGAFGVVLVTTKKGKSGKMNISYNNNFGFAGLTVSTDFMTNGYDAAKLNDEAFIRATGNSYTGYTPQDYEELLKRKTDPTLPDVVIQNRNGKDQYVYYGNTDWWDFFYRDLQTSSEHALTMSGATDKINFYLSGRTYEKNGIMQIQQDKYKGYNLRAKLEGQLTNWIRVSNNGQINFKKYTYPGWNSSANANNNFISTTVHALPSYLPVNPDGTYTYRTELNNYTIGDGIMADLLYGKSKGQEKEYEFTNQSEAVVSIVDGVNVTANYTFSYNPIHTFNRRTQAPWSIYPGEVSYLGYDRLTEAQVTNQVHTVNIFANYIKKVNNHNFGATVGYNREHRNYDRIGGIHNDLLSEDLNDFDLGTGDMTVSGGANTWALEGYFGRLTYNFQEKYLFEVNGRYDGTSKFPSNQRFGFFPSVSAGWRVSEEKFLSAIKEGLNEFKLRASYGELGNAQEASVYGYIPLMNAGLSNYIQNGSKTQYISSPTPISSDLTWERTNTLNLGVDLAFAKSRFNVSFDYYIRKTLDMLIPGKTLPAVFGASSPKMNAGDLKNNGWELSLSWRDDFELAAKPFSYSISAGLSDSKAKITRFDNPRGILTDYYVGQELGEIWGYRVDGFFKSDEEATNWKINQDYVDNVRLTAPGEWSRLQAGDLKYMDLNGDNVVNQGNNTLDNPGDQVIIGNSRARYTYGFNFGANWNGFDISAFFQGIGRQHWYPGTNADKFWGPYSRPYYTFVPEDFEKDIWTPENPDAYYPLLRGYIALNSRGSLVTKNDRYLQNIGYLRLKNLTIGYKLKEEWIKKAKLNSLRLFVSGENIWTATKFRTDYIDPEQAAQESNGRAYPYSKTFSFGVDLTF